MARILGIDIPNEKRIDISLRYIYGIGPKLSNEILEKTEIDGATRAKDLTEDQLAKIVHTIQEDGYIVEGDLRRKITMNLKRLKSIRAYRGIRHERGLPVRGQRTSTNARTRKGAKKTVGAKRTK